MEPVLTVRIAYPKIGSGKHKNSLYSMNVLDKIHWSTKMKIHQRLKLQLKEWYFEPHKGEPYKRLTITCKVLRHTRRKFDAVNAASVVKVVEDILTDLGYVNDDDSNHIDLPPSEYVSGLDETMLEINVKGER